jgi:hypothetical protein
LARTVPFAGQYQNSQMAVSRSAFATVSVPKSGAMIAPFSSQNVLDIRPKSAGKARLDLDRRTEAVQYQTPESQHADRRLMLRIALGLGLAYVVFMVCWIWATRLRSRRPRH